MISTPSTQLTSCPPALSVVVPVHDEVGNIGTLVREIATELRPRMPFEIIVVDDASRDGTDDELLATALDVPELRVLIHSRNAGQSTAVRSGVRAARAQLIVTLDGDGQNDPADIATMLEVRARVPAFVQLIAGVRTVRRDRLIKRFASRVANRIRGYLLNDLTPDSGCGLKMFDRAVFFDLPYFDHMHRFLPALVRRNGGEVMHVPVNHRARTVGVSKYGTVDRLLAGIADLRGVMWLIRRSRATSVSEVSLASSSRKTALPWRESKVSGAACVNILQFHRRDDEHNR